MGAPLAARWGGTEAVSGRGWVEDTLTRVGRMLDRAALAGMRLAFTETLHPHHAAAALEASARVYLSPALARDPRAFFAFLDAPPPVPETRVAEHRPIPGGDITVHELASAYEPWHPSDSWLCCAENARVPFQHWTHRDGRPRATVIALHGFTMGRPWIDARVLMATHWFGLGFDVVLPILPFHGPRSPRGARYSGEGFASWDVGRLNEAVRQAVHDVDLVRRWLVARGHAPVGLVGLSLGGYLTALLAGLCPTLAFAIPIAAPSSLAWLPHRLFGLGAILPVRPPVSRELLDAGYRVHSPLHHRLAIDSRRVFVVGGRGDAVVPPAQVEALWRHWGEPAIHWFDGGHTTPFGRMEIMARIDAHLRSLPLASERTAAQAAGGDA